MLTVYNVIEIIIMIEELYAVSWRWNINENYV